jgi:hypothetical protein
MRHEHSYRKLAIGPEDLSAGDFARFFRFVLASMKDRHKNERQSPEEYSFSTNF